MYTYMFFFKVFPWQGRKVTERCKDHFGNSVNIKNKLKK